MSPREVLHRVVEAGRREAWRRRPLGWAEPGSPEPFPSFPQVRRGLAAAAQRIDPAFADSLARSFDGNLRFLGHDWPPYRTGPDSGFWFYDPVHGGRWPGPDISSFGIDVRSTWPEGTPAQDWTRGDVKYVWESNRLQFLHPLAVALAGGDQRAGPRALVLLRDWWASNPPYGGVNWISGIELALRLVGIALLCAAAGPEGFAPEDRALLRTIVIAHARHLAAFPSLFSSANNHRVAEGLGLLISGLLIGQGDTAWEREGRTILAVEADHQILPDGVGAEQSPTYQAFTMEMLCVGVLLSRDVSRPLAPSISDRLAGGATFLVALMNHAGVLPRIGDDDEGRVLAQPPDREPRYAASIAAAVAGLTGRADLLPPARAPHWRDDLFDVASLGLTLPRRPDSMAEPKIFREGGYTVARGAVARREIVLIFDHGPLGYLSLAAHGHADALALWLDVDRIPVLIDSGTFLYHSGRAHRTALRESLAHSTLSVAGQTQSVASPAFSWATRAKCNLTAEHPGPSWSVTGRHDGYHRRFGVTHERSLRREPGGFAIHDRLVNAQSTLPVEIRFMLDPDLRVEVGNGVIVVLTGSEPLCSFHAPIGFSTAVVEGSRAPSLSRRFGTIGAGQALVFTGSLGCESVKTEIAILPRRSTT